MPYAKLLFYSIGMFISHDIATTFHFAMQFHFKGVFESRLMDDGVSAWIDNHLVVPFAKLLFYSIGMFISHDIATTFHFAMQFHFKGVFESRLIQKKMKN